MLASLGWCRPESFSSRGETDMFQYSALDVPSVDGSDADKTARLYSYTDADAVGVPLKTRPRSEHSLHTGEQEVHQVRTRMGRKVVFGRRHKAGTGHQKKAPAARKLTVGGHMNTAPTRAPKPRAKKPAKAAPRVEEPPATGVRTRLDVRPACSSQPSSRALLVARRCSEQRDRARVVNQRQP